MRNIALLSLLFLCLPIFALAGNEVKQGNAEITSVQIQSSTNDPTPTLIAEPVREAKRIQTSLEIKEGEGAATASNVREQERESNEGENKEVQNKADQALQRKSRVANVAQELSHVADRNSGIGEQIREIARTQEESCEYNEQDIEAIQQRKGVTKFFIGPNYTKINAVEQRLEKHVTDIETLQELKATLGNIQDGETVDLQIQEMEQVRNELQEELQTEKKGFSLFGWLNRWLSN